MFNTLKNPLVPNQEKITILSSLTKEINQRVSYGNCSGGKLHFLSGLINAIVDVMNDSEASPLQLESYFKTLEIEYKKFMYIFILEGSDTYIKNTVHAHLHKQEYQVAEKLIDNFPYYITLTFNDDLNYSSNNIPVESYINHIYHANIHYQINMKRYHELSDTNAVGVVTGLSYTYYAINPDMLSDKVAMLATPSQDLFYDFEMLKMAYRDHGDSLRYVIAGLCPYSLRYDLSLSKGINRRTLEYHKDFGTIHHYQPDISDTLSSIEKAIYDIWGYNLIEEVFYQYLYPPYIMETGISTSNWIFNSDNVPQEHLDDIYSKYHKDYPDTLKENTLILSQYIQFCSEHNLRLFFLMPPFSDFYKQNWDSNYINELWETVHEVGKDYNYTILDFSDEKWENYYFGDYAHLNKIGAVRFTPMLDKIIQQELNL